MTVSSGDGATGSTASTICPNAFHILLLPSVHPMGPPWSGLVRHCQAEGVTSCKLRIQLRMFKRQLMCSGDLLHIRLIMHKLPPGKVINPSHHVQQVTQRLSPSLPRFPIPDLTSTKQVLCRYQIDNWTPSFIYSANPAMGGLMLPWLDLGKSASMTADPDGKDHLKEPVPQFLMQRHPQPTRSGIWTHQAAVHENQNRAICTYLMLGNAVFDALTAYHTLHAGFHQPFGIEFGSLARGPTLVHLMPANKEKTALEFIYWWFDNRLERVEQLIPHLEYDIGLIVNTPQNNLSLPGEDETLAHPIQQKAEVSIQIAKRQHLDDVPTTKSLWSFVHGCFQTIDMDTTVSWAYLWGMLPVSMGSSSRFSDQFSCALDQGLATSRTQVVHMNQSKKSMISTLPALAWPYTEIWLPSS
ncbi:hypothetical protein EDD85DRAFT_798998 [Armillaria nabsnona]|nr:hypothetical protein EDD85DRAFT_798998 [Armillaria nabsnona]